MYGLIDFIETVIFAVLSFMLAIFFGSFSAIVAFVAYALWASIF